MEAKLIGPAAELGDIGDGLNFFGNVLTREFSEINVSADELEKLKTNRFVEFKGADKALTPEKAKVAAHDADQKALVVARLHELGVSFDARKSVTDLEAILDKAEKAHAKAEEAAADEQTEA